MGGGVLVGEFKYHLVNWKKICIPGGLGIRSLVSLSQALLGNQLRRKCSLEERSGLKICGVAGAQWLVVVLMAFVSRIILERVGGKMSNFINFEVFNGTNACFWHD